MPYPKDIDSTLLVGAWINKDVVKGFVLATLGLLAGALPYFIARGFGIDNGTIATNAGVLGLFDLSLISILARSRRDKRESTQ